MADKEARIRIGLENATQTISDLDKIKAGFRGISDALVGVKKLADDASGAIVRIRPLNLTKVTDEAQEFRKQITQLSFATTGGGKAVDYLTAKMEATGVAIKRSAAETTAFVMGLGKMTGDFKGAVSAAESFGRAANNMGADLEDVKSIGASLYSSLGVPLKDIAAEMEDFGRIAENVGTRGGKMGLLTSLQELGPNLEKYDTSTPEKRKRLAAFVALAGGQSPHAQATGDAGSLLQWFGGSDAIGVMRRILGHDIVKDGKVSDPFQILQELKKKLGGQGRGKASMTRVLQNYSTLTAGQKAMLMKALDLEDAYLGKQEAETGRKYGLQGVGAYDLGEAEKAPAIPGAMILSQPAAKIRVLTPEEQARANRMPDVVDPFSATPHARTRAAELERENVERGIGREMLKGRDKYEQTLSAEEKIQLESTIGGLGNVPLVGGALQSGAHALTAAEFDPRIPDRAQGPTRSERILEEQLREQRKTNELLNKRRGNTSTRDVGNRKSATND